MIATVVDDPERAHIRFAAGSTTSLAQHPRSYQIFDANRSRKDAGASHSCARRNNFAWLIWINGDAVICSHNAITAMQRTPGGVHDETIPKRAVAE